MKNKLPDDLLGQGSKLPVNEILKRRFVENLCLKKFYTVYPLLFFGEKVRRFPYLSLPISSRFYTLRPNAKKVLDSKANLAGEMDEEILRDSF